MARRRLVTVLLLLLASQVIAQEGPEDSAATASPFSYGKNGLQFESAGGNNYLWFGVRLQPRYANERFSQDLLPGEPISTESELKLNRGRLKLGGHLVSPGFTVYSEYDIVGSRLLDLRASYKFSDWLNVRIGQWKSDYNRERIDSSGKQQFVERSVVTPWFTIDRQQGVSVSGRVGKGKSWDTSYWVERLSGAGRGGSHSDADGLWLGRLQWNVGGELLGFSQSDLARNRKGAGSVTIGAVSGRSSYTSFSGDGGGQLPGYTQGAPDQYELDQFLVETAWHKNGFSWQNEFHWKSVLDRSTGVKQMLTGRYFQAGMFFAEVWDWVPEPLEFALRYASVDPNLDVESDIDRESTIATNWFFNGHRNKLSFDISKKKRRLAPENDSGTVYRLQWDWSF
jgi:phosphate-selective porin OprO/OprP